MATVTTNVLLEGVRGTIGNTLVFKTIRGKTFVSAKARMRDKKKESVAQRNTRVTFRQASEWAQLTLLNPEKKLYYQQRARVLKLPNAYTAAITDYMRKPKIVKTKHRDTITYDISKTGFDIKHVSARLTDNAGLLMRDPRLVTQPHDNWWFVNYSPDKAASSITLIITDNTLRETTFIDVHE